MKLVILIMLSWMGMSASVLAHGVKLGYHMDQAIVVKAGFDSGETMNNTLVMVYAPNNPDTPWLQGKTNEKGEFIFIPDSNLVGNWQVKIRQAGHGGIINIPIQAQKQDQKMVSPSTVSPATTQVAQISLTQKWIMAIAVIWGFVGTGLYFMRSNK